MQRYVVLGATGFIGRNTAIRLGRDFPGQILAVWHRKPPREIPGVQWAHADLCNDADVQSLLQKDDIVIHAAAVTSGACDIIERPYIYVTDNAVMTSLLLKHAYHNKIKQFLWFSCAQCYDGTSDRKLTEEDFDTNIISSTSKYFGAGATKEYLSKMLQFFSQIGDMKTSLIRHTNNYGPYDKYDFQHAHMFGATIAKVMQAKEGSSITVWGSGTEKRDILYVDDLVDAIVTMLDQKNTFEVVNIGAGQCWSVNEIVKKIIDASGKSLNIQHDLSKPTIPVSITVSYDKAKRIFGWEPKTSLDEGIRKTLAWYQENHRDGH